MTPDAPGRNRRPKRPRLLQVSGVRSGPTNESLSDAPAHPRTRVPARQLAARNSGPACKTEPCFPTDHTEGARPLGRGRCISWRLVSCPMGRRRADRSTPHQRPRRALLRERSPPATSSPRSRTRQDTLATHVAHGWRGTARTACSTARPISTRSLRRPRSVPPIVPSPATMPSIALPSRYPHLPRAHAGAAFIPTCAQWHSHRSGLALR